MSAFSTESFSSPRSMLFYQTRRPNAFSTRHVTSRPFTTAEAGERLHATWMLKTVGMGVTLLGLSYWLVHIAGVQYLASLTSATLVAFLLAYMVWWLRRARFARQVQHSSTPDKATACIFRCFCRVSIERSKCLLQYICMRETLKDRPPRSPNHF